MNDEQIMQKGGDESDIEAYANQNGANLTKYDVDMKTKIQEQQFMTRRNSELIVVNDEPMLAYNGLKLDEQVEASMLVAYNHAQQTLHQELQKAREEERKKVLWNIGAMIEEADFARKVTERIGEALPTLEVQAVIKQVQTMLDSYQSELDQPTEEIPGFEGTMEALDKLKI